MTEEAQRIAIAEACGWKYVDYFPGTTKVFSTWLCPKCNPHEEAPDYLNDLNAIIPAIAAQPIEIQERVAKLLGCHIDFAVWITTPAKNMSEALIHALGKWDDSK